MSFPVTGLTPGYTLAIDDTYIYTSQSNTTIVAVAKSTGAITSLGSGGETVLQLATNATNVYWLQGVNPTGNTGQILSILKTGGGVTTILSGRNYLTALAADASNVYWTEWSTGTFSSGVVLQMANTGGPITTLATGQLFPNGYIAVDASNVYWSGYGGDYGLYQTPIGGGPVTTLINSGSGLFPGQIVSDGTNVYFVNGTNPGSVGYVPVGGGSTTILATGQNIPAGIAIFGDGIIWTDQGDSTVWMVSKEGGPVVQVQSSLGPRGSFELGGIAVDGTGAYFSGQANDTLYYASIPSMSLINGNSTFTADGDVQANAIAPLAGHSTLNVLTALPVAMAQDQGNEKMYVLDLLGPSLLVFDTTSQNGTSPPLVLPAYGSIAPIDLSTYATIFNPKLQFDPVLGAVWLIGTSSGFNRILGIFVTAGGDFISALNFGAGVSGAMNDFVVTPDPVTAGNSLVLVATDTVEHVIGWSSVSPAQSVASGLFDYQNGVLDTTSEIQLLSLDTIDGPGLLSAVVFDSAGPSYSLGIIELPPSGYVWANTPQAFTNPVDAVYGLAATYTTEDVGGVAYISLFQGGPPNPSEETGPFIGSTFGTGPVIGSFPGFLGPQTQMFFGDIVGDLFTTSFPPGSSQYLTTPTNPITSLYGVPTPDATYPNSDQSGLWGLAPIGSDGFAHLYRYSFTSTTLIDLPFVEPPPPPPVEGGEVIYTTRFFEGYNLSDLPTTPAEFVLKVAGASATVVNYLLRASCSSAPDGYIFWQNTTGDNTGQPTCSGTLGPTFIMSYWESGT